MDIRIIPECYVDTALMEVLGFGITNHKLNNSEVIKTLDNKGYNNTIGIGVIDRDKNQPKRLKDEYKVIKRVDDLELYQKRDNSNRFIIVHPVIEKWIDSEAQKYQINRNNYGLPQDFKAFKDMTKDINISKKVGIKNYLSTIQNQQNSGFQKLKSLIIELLNNA